MPTSDSQPTTLTRAQQDYAIEFGEYLAIAAEQFMAEQNRSHLTGAIPNSDYWSALSSAIYEFRKRAARVA